MHKTLVILLFAASLLLSGCSQSAPGVLATAASTAAAQDTTGSLPEYPVRLIPLAGAAASSSAEFSGMDWFGDVLILLPQYPQRFGSSEDGALLAIPKKELLDYLDGINLQPLLPEEIPLVATGIAQKIKGFEGYEAIAIQDDRVYLTVEARHSGMSGYLLQGTIAPDLSEVRLDNSQMAEILPQAALENMSDEAMIIYDRRIYSFYEANGAGVNPAPVSHVFDESLQPIETVPFPNIAYRITDATRADEQGRFWAINYLYPGDARKLKVGDDPIADRYGKGATHLLYRTVERLLAFQVTPTGIVLQDQPPIQLQLIDDNHSRNWEGIAALDERGFLLVTDSFPETILGFVSYP